MYDVMATDPGRPRRRERSASEHAGRGRLLVARPPPHDRRRGGGRADPGARAARARARAYLFYDCQTDDVRLVLTVLGEAERFGAVLLNGAEVTERARRATGAPPASPASRPSPASASRSRADNVVNATGVWADRIRPEEILDGGGGPADRAEPRHPRDPLDASDLADRHGRLHRPGGRRADDLRAALVRAGADRHDRQRLRGRHRPRAAGRRRHRVPARRGRTRSSAPTLGRGDLTGAYAGVRPLISTGDPKKSVDISRKAELYETSSGMLTITGGKLTTWRRMAKQVVDRMVEREGREAPCRTDEIPLGHGRRRRATCETASRALPDGRSRAARLPLRPRRAQRSSTSARERPELAAPIVAGPPRPARRGRDRRPARAGALGRRRAAAAHPARPAGGARSCATADGPRSPSLGASSLGEELGWSEAAESRGRGSEAWPDGSAAGGGPRSAGPHARRGSLSAPAYACGAPMAAERPTPGRAARAGRASSGCRTTAC